jgi:hypothetical protein
MALKWAWIKSKSHGGLDRSVSRLAIPFSGPTVSLLSYASRADVRDLRQQQLGMVNRYCCFLREHCGPDLKPFTSCATHASDDTLQSLSEEGDVIKH